MVLRERPFRRDLLVELAQMLLAASNPPDLAAWGRVLTEKVTLRIGNRTPRVDRAGALAELGWLFAKVRSLGQGFEEVWPGSDGQTLFMELDITPLGGGVPLPLAIILRTLETGPAVVDIRFYVDPAPLFTEPSRPAKSVNEDEKHHQTCRKI